MPSTATGADDDVSPSPVETTTHTTPGIVSELISAYEELVAVGEIEA